MPGNHGRDCLLCGGTMETCVIAGVPARGKVYDIFFCRACEVGATVPMPGPEELTDLYAPGTYREAKGRRFHPLVESAVKQFRNARKKRIERHIKGGRLLDVGCGRGLFLRVMRSGGWSVAGVEFSEESAADAAGSDGFPVVSGPPDQWGFPDGSFDVVTMNHVLEHVPGPADHVGGCARLLKAGGILVVAVPNLSSLQASFGGGNWFHLDVPHHLHHFSEGGLRRLLENRGFAVIKAREFDLEYNPYGWLQTLLNKSGIGRNFLFDRLKSGTLREAGSPPGSIADAFLTTVLLPAYVPLALVLSLVESFLLRRGRGGTVELIAVKR